MNATSPKIIFFVVIAITSLAAIGLGTTCFCAVQQIKITEAAATALNSYTSALIGALIGLLVNTRSNTHTQEVTVVNPKSDPVQTEEKK